MSDQDILESIRVRLECDHEYFSNKNKSGRERYVASLFLSVLGVEHFDDSLRSPDQSSKADVEFCDLSFQIKELTDDSLRRNDLYKNALKSARSASCLAELRLGSACEDWSALDTMHNLVLRYLVTLDTKYSSGERKNLDLLFYITRRNAGLIRYEELADDIFSSFGWRSISCVNEKQAVVLHASKCASQILKNFCGKIIFRMENQTNV